MLAILTVIAVLLILIGLVMKYVILTIKYADRKCFPNGPPDIISGNNPLNSCLKDTRTNEDDVLYHPNGGVDGNTSDIYKIDPTNIIRAPFILGFLILCFCVYKKLTK
jgi:hypothetical protein